MPKASKSEQMDYAGLEIIADEFTGTFNGDLVVADLAAVAALTGTVGTANDAMTAVPASVASVGADTSAATKVSVDAAITAINNNLADLQAKVNVILAALKA